MGIFSKEEKKTEENQEEAISPYQLEIITIGHCIKYNLYALAKAIVFASLVTKSKNPKDAAAKTNDIIDELDLQTKQAKELAKLSKEKADALKS